MTVPTTNITTGPYTGNGLSDEYDYDFKITDESQLTVYETDDDGVRTELVLNTDYTVTGVGVTGGGTVVRTAGNLPTDYTWYIRSNFVPKQETSFASQGGFFPAVHEKAFDLLTYLVQQLIDRIGRSLRFSDGYSGSAVAVIPDPVANYYFRWNEDGTALVADPGVGGFDANNKLYKRILRTYLTGTSSLALSVPADISVGDIVFVNAYSPTSDISPSSWSCVSLGASLPGGATAGVVNNASNGDLYLLNTGSNYYQFRQVSKNKNIIRGISRLRETTGSPGADDVFVSFHTTAGDGGYGDFRWVSGASAGTYVDNNGTIIVPTGGDGSAAWLREYNIVDVLMFGADKTGVADSYAAFSAALAVSSFVYVPPGTYKIGTTITITGNKTITGVDGGTQAQQSSSINFTGTGNLFAAVSAEYGGVCIKNLKIAGGDGSYAIRSSRPQSLFENILIESDYTGGGIELFEAGTGSQASWGCTIRNCKWVGPATPSTYRGYQVDINGGHVTIENCTAIYGAIGLNIDQGEAINVIRCSFNQQTSTYSSSAATDTAGIRLSGAGYKKAISIRNCYIESFTHGIYVEKCESLSIEDNYIADTGNNSNYASIYLKDSNVKSVTIRNNNISDQGSSSDSIKIGGGAQDVLISNNIIVSTGTASSCIKKIGTTPSYIFRNNLTSGGAGYTFLDADYGLVNLDFDGDGFSSGKRRDFTASPNTWYDIATVASNQIWHLSIVDGNSPGTWSREDMLYIDSSGTAVFKTINNTNPGYSTREWQVSAGILQFRVVSGGNTLNNVAAQLMV